ncbi:MAG: hypothetical protein JNK75_05890 [Betaproteobacteria bacterium]|nr:hypothetical protein [Betaproteobacteria bacterium]
MSAPPATDPSAGTAVAVSPPVVDAFADVPVTFTVTGGTKPYQAFSSNSVALPVEAAIQDSTFVVVPKPVTADTLVDITVRDAANVATTARATLKPSVLNNQVTFTPFAPTAAGCGNNAVCSGGDAQIVVKAVQNGVVLRNRAIRFDVFQGNFSLSAPGSGQLVNTLTINTDEQGEAVARVTANTGAATQVATLQTTDTTSGLSRRYNFNIVQQVSGTGILTTLPSGKVTFKGAKGLPGQPGSCPQPGFARVDFYVFGGTPPYRVVSPLPELISVNPSLVTTNGGSFTATMSGCGSTPFIVTDATNRSVETSIVEGTQGDAGDAVPATVNQLTSVTPNAITIACGQSASITLTGTGNFTSTQAVGGGNGFSVTPSAGVLPSVVTLRAFTGGVTTPVTINFTSGATTFPVIVTVTGTAGGNCP